jgi:hypothetical protein
MNALSMITGPRQRMEKEYLAITVEDHDQLHDNIVGTDAAIFMHPTT